MLIRDSIPNLIAGVSQQPPAQRLPTHCDVADNCFLSPADGLTKRPPTTHLATVLNSFPDRPFIHWINRSETERYCMVFQSGSVNIFDLAGNSYPVYASSSGGAPTLSYLNCSNNPDQSLKAITIEDTTYVLNTEKKVAMVAGGTDGLLHWKTTLVWVRTAILGGTYNVGVDGFSYTYTAPTTGTVTTDSIAAALTTGLTSVLATHPYVVNGGGSVIQIVRNDGSDFQQLSLVDSGGGTSLTAVTNTVQKFSDLPNIAPAQLVVKVTPGDPNQGVPSSAGSYYVQFQQKAISPGSFLWLGVWQECPGPSTTSNQFDATTMPWQMVRLQDNVSGTVTGTPFKLYFTFQTVPWGARICGDSANVPNPSFVGNTINDIFLYRARLGVLTDSKVVLSQVNGFNNFWRTTMLTTLDTDPIDVSAAHPRVVRLRHAVPWSQDLIIFGDSVQFILSAADTLTPSTVKLTAATEYESDPYCKPIPVANMVYLPYVNNGYGAIREYFVEYYTQRRVGKSITDQIPKYISGKLIKLTHCISSDLIAGTVDTDRGSLYIYKWLWQGNTLYSTDKLQSAWSRWNFDQTGAITKVYSTFFIGQQMYLLVGRNISGSLSVNLETLSADALPNDGGGTTFVTYLDRRCVNTGFAITPPANAGVVSSYNGGTNQTTFTLPYSIPSGAVMQVVTQLTGVILPIVATGSNFVKVNGNYTGTGVFIGNLYTMRYRFSPIYMREDSKLGANVPVLGGRLQLRTIAVNFVGTGYFRFEITPQYRSVNVVPYTGRTLGNSGALLGSVPLISDRFRVLVGSAADKVQIDLVNDSFLPCRFSSAEWEGMFYARGKRA